MEKIHMKHMPHKYFPVMRHTESAHIGRTPWSVQRKLSFAFCYWKPYPTSPRAKKIETYRQPLPCHMDVSPQGVTHDTGKSKQTD
jgi:hypothetical protein